MRGGPLMWPLLLCSIVSLTISIERIFFWWKERKQSDDVLLEEVFLRTEKGDFDSALSVRDGGASGNKKPGFATRILLFGLAHRGSGLTPSMEVAATDEIRRMKRGLNVLDTIITMAPLLGILGTVLGIIDSFDLLGSSGIEDPKAVTGGIAQALITTATGLAVALVTLVPFNYLVGKVQKATEDTNKLIVRFEAAYQKGLEVTGSDK